MRTKNTKWKFQVRGTFVRGGTGAPIDACEAVVESGDRAEISPFRLEGVGPGARAQVDGTFFSWFVTQGTNSEIEAPPTVSVFVRVAPAARKPYVIGVQRELASRISATEMLLQLGQEHIEHGEKLYVA